MNLKEFGLALSRLDEVLAKEGEIILTNKGRPFGRVIPPDRSATPKANRYRGVSLDSCEVLPDVATRRLRVLFCGSAVGPESYRQGAYYAHPRNKFWTTLEAIGLTSTKIAPKNYRRALEFGLGLTDLAKNAHGRDDEVRPHDYDPSLLLTKVKRLKPHVLAFAGLKPAQVFMKHVFDQRSCGYGLQSNRIANTAIFVLPSPSPRNGHWNVAPWHALGGYVRTAIS